MQIDKDTRKKRSLSCFSEQNLCQDLHLIFVGTSYIISWACLSSVYGVPAPGQFFCSLVLLESPWQRGCPRVAQDSLQVPWLLQTVPRPPPMLRLSLPKAQLIHLWNGKVLRAALPFPLEMSRGSTARKERWKASCLLASFFAEHEVWKIYSVRDGKRIGGIISCFIGPERTVTFIYSDICVQSDFITVLSLSKALVT